MITLSLNVSNPADLNAYLDILQARGLLHAVKPVSIPTPRVPAIKKPAVAGATEVRGNGGSYFKELHAKVAARLAELGLTKRPPATEEEMELRAMIDKDREEKGLKGINWKVDLFGREEALQAEGYDIYANVNGDETTDEPEEEVTDFNIDLSNPVV